MYFRETIGALGARTRSPYSWIAVAVFGGMFACVGIMRLRAYGLQGPLLWSLGSAGSLATALAYGFLSPIPWQWTGDSREIAPALRGALQCALFGLVYLAGVHMLDRFLETALLTHRHAHPFRLRLFPYIYQTPFMILVGYFISLGERSEHEKWLAQKHLKKAQWILLRAQMSPHVLFNTLNALAELARRDPVATERSLLDLSEFYERMLQHSDQLLAPLSKEREILERFLALQKLRLGERLQIEWQWDSAIDTLCVPPLLLQPLAENALKHGISRQSGPGQLRILGHQHSGQLHLEIANTGCKPSPSKTSGTGLHNLQERLKLAYRHQARFQLLREGDWTRAMLQLPDQPWH